MRHFDRIWDDMESYIRLACSPENGHLITYEPVHWMRETNEQGDVIYRRLTADEVTALEANEEEGNK